MLGDSSLRAYLVGIDFLGSKQFRSAQCCISFVRESKSAGGPSLMSNFGRAAAVEISQICCGLAPTAPPFLRAICSIPSFGIAKFAAARSAWRYQQKYQQSGPLQCGLMLGFSIPRDSFPGKFGTELAPYVFVIAIVFSVVPLAGNRLVP
jgi:hypothetical protein